MPNDYLWTGDEFENCVTITCYRIVKQTAKRLYIAQGSGPDDTSVPLCWRDRVYIVDRAKAEPDGSFYLRAIRQFLYRTRAEAEAHFPKELIEEMHRTGQNTIDAYMFYRERETPEERAEHLRRVEEYLSRSPVMPGTRRDAS